MRKMKNNIELSLFCLKYGRDAHINSQVWVGGRSFQMGGGSMGHAFLASLYGWSSCC